MSDERQRRILESKEFLADNRVQCMLEQLTAELVQHKPNHPIDYLIKRLRQMKDGGQDQDQHQRSHVVFILGPPGSGKGTQCAKVVEDFGSVHLRAGDILRAEVRLGTDEGKQIAEHINAKEPVPSDLTIRLLKREIQKHGSNQTFLIDGFPRELTQAMTFEAEVGECTFVLSLEADEDTLRARLDKRHQVTGSPDDEPAAIKERFDNFRSKTQPVLEYYNALGKLRKIDASLSPSEVWASVSALFK
eukprot:TRINITY_DN16578_c0_g1_i1.p1 TRINITY_DN16578_c0_g1~~TRINITY_DN16578_c0_g1_i1.p1  ORF type:complete len:247 (+),score=47.36 TRINITY_DN16578_c0_g1_i1:53-793(+)